MIKQNSLVTGECYHILNKSIAGFRIFNEDQEFMRILNLIRYYQWTKIPVGFSNFIRLQQVENIGLDSCISNLSYENERHVAIIAYCFMPTHIHLVAKQLNDNGISKFMSNVLNGYTRYFNVKYRRKGPLWVGRFKRVLIESDEQLWHLSRYVHLNPVTAGLVQKPQNWQYSSYKEYLNMVSKNKRISFPDSVFDIDSDDYKKFVEDRIEYQKELGSIKNLLLD